MLTKPVVKGTPPPSAEGLGLSATDPGRTFAVKPCRRDAPVVLSGARRTVGRRNLVSWLVPSPSPRRSSASERTFPLVQATVVDRTGLLVGRFAAEP